MKVQIDEEYTPKAVSNFSKYHRPDDVLRKGRLYKGEKRYRGNSSMAPRKTHNGKGVTLRSHRPKGEL